VRLTGHSVILASGGFQGNSEMLTRYLGPRAIYLRPMSIGCYYNKGEGIQMALDAGAAACGDFGSWHASPMDPRSDRAGPSLYIYPYGILVNKHGVRFTDEAPGWTDETYERVTRQIFAQPEGMAYIILDARSLNLPTMASAVRTEKAAIEATSLEELARKLEIPAETLTGTVAAYNTACPGTASDPLVVDGVATRGLVPPKSNWAVPIDQAPYRAYPVISSIVFTFGGLKVNTKAQVLNTDGEAIPGLYAAGELMGLYYANYTGASSVLKGAVFGRIAGTDAAERARADLAPAQAVPNT
jgi:tricarballylate dehydrogenase